MFLIWLLWIIVVIGGFYMGIGSAIGAYHNGFDVTLLVNAIVYTGCALYGLPRFFKFVFAKK